MANGNNIHDEVKEQRKKLKDLSFSGKIEYILNYYKIPIIAVILAVLFAGSLTYSIIRNNYDTVCFIAVLDGRITGYDDDTDVLSTGLTDYLGIDGKKEQVDLSYTFSLQEKEMEYIDYFCTDKNIFFWDLRDLFSTEELETLSDYIIYYTNSSGESFPIAVDISEAPVIKDSDINMKQPCYGIVSTSKYSENAANFIRFVFNMEKP